MSFHTLCSSLLFSPVPDLTRTILSVNQFLPLAPTTISLLSRRHLAITLEAYGSEISLSQALYAINYSLIIGFLALVMSSSSFNQNGHSQPSVPPMQAFSPAYAPTTLFLGGTQGLAEAFARHMKGNAHIAIIGRNRATAGSVTKDPIARLPKINF